MNKQQLISVVIPVYNAEAFIEACLLSLIEQTIKPFEIIVVNDASTDQTPEIVKRWSETDSSIRCINLPPKSNGERRTAMALNTGISAASGAYIALMDADDSCFPHRLERQLTYMLQNRVTALGAAVQVVNESEKPSAILVKPESQTELMMRLPVESPFYQNTVMFDRSLLLATGLTYDTQFHYAEDYEFFSRLARVTTIANLAEPLVYYRQHREQSVRTEGFESFVKQVVLRECQLAYHFDTHQAEQFWKWVNHRKGLESNEVPELKTYARSIIKLNQTEKFADPALFERWIDDLLLKRLLSRNSYRLTMIVELFQTLPLRIIISHWNKVGRFMLKCILGKAN